jgi:hypothetical protein
MIGNATSRQHLQQGKVAKYWIESLAPHQASLRHRNCHTPRAVRLTPAPGLQSCCPHRSNTMAETHTEAEAHRSLSFRKQLPSMPRDLARRPLDPTKWGREPSAIDATCLHNNCARPAACRRSDGPWPQHCCAPPQPPTTTSFPASPQGRCVTLQNFEYWNVTKIH